jgi:hypothetical protein
VATWAGRSLPAGLMFGAAVVPGGGARGRALAGLCWRKLTGASPCARGDVRSLTPVVVVSGPQRLVVLSRSVRSRRPMRAGSSARHRRTSSTVWIRSLLARFLFARASLGGYSCRISASNAPSNARTRGLLSVRLQPWRSPLPRLDRLAPSTLDLLHTVDVVSKAGAGFRSLRTLGRTRQRPTGS